MSWRLLAGSVPLGAMLMVGLGCSSGPPQPTNPFGSTQSGTTSTSGGSSSVSPSQTGRAGGTTRVEIPDGGLADAPQAFDATEEGATCAVSTERAHLTPVNMIFIVDKSGSMGAEGQSNEGEYDRRWKPLKEAFTAFFEDPGGAREDLFASLDFFPPTNCDMECSCKPEEYKPPRLSVPLTELTNTEPFLRALSQTEPSGGTPTIAALQGSLEYASEVAQKNPGSKTVVILITDGEPAFGELTPDGRVVMIEGCPGNNIETIAELVERYWTGSLHIPTYVIGVGPSLESLETIAAAGGHPLKLIPVEDPVATKNELVEEFRSIRKTEFSCQLKIQPPEDGGSIDFGKVNVIYTPSGATEGQRIPNNPNCLTSGRQDGWQYDNPVSPTRVELCPSTCNQLSQDPGATVSIEFGCETVLIAY